MIQDLKRLKKIIRTKILFQTSPKSNSHSQSHRLHKGCSKMTHQMQTHTQTQMLIQIHRPQNPHPLLFSSFQSSFTYHFSFPPLASSTSSSQSLINLFLKNSSSSNQNFNSESFSTYSWNFSSTSYHSVYLCSCPSYFWLPF